MILGGKKRQDPTTDIEAGVQGAFIAYVPSAEWDVIEFSDCQDFEDAKWSMKFQFPARESAFGSLSLIHVRLLKSCPLIVLSASALLEVGNMLVQFVEMFSLSLELLS